MDPFNLSKFLFKAPLDEFKEPLNRSSLQCSKSASRFNSPRFPCFLLLLLASIADTRGLIWQFGPWASKASQCNCFKPETIARRLIQWRGVGAYTKGDTFEDCYYLPRSGTDREEMVKRGKYRIYRLRLDGLPADE